MESSGLLGLSIYSNDEAEEISVIGATRTYADKNVTERGKYWQRVLAYNSLFDGIPSKVSK